jgi:cobyrinic acid a,c-diamide synthase
MSSLSTPRVVIAGLGGDSGKTLVTLGLVRAAVRRGLGVQTFKKGPDYIDPAWLTAASGRPCRSLDTFLMDDSGLDRALETADDSDLAVVEGNRGLFDGLDAGGTHSTAELAKRIGAPVLLVVDATKTTRTAAAPVAGCRALDPDLDLAGVILNRVANERHERIIREAIEGITGVPVVGTLPRLGGTDPLPGRHLGLVTVAEYRQHEDAIDRAADAVESGVDLEAVLDVARYRTTLALRPLEGRRPGSPVTIGYLRDEAFSFYYPDNLESLTAAGADLVPVAPSNDALLGQIEGLYIGGGFPEVHAPRLAARRRFGQALRDRVAAGLPVYAECGGLMFLARELRVEGVRYPMTGVLDLVVEHTSRPCGHGYVEAVVDRPNGFAEVGVRRRGHEFHYSRIVDGADVERTVLRLDRGSGVGGGRDAVVKGSVWASYLHVHALGEPDWADGLLRQARQLRSAAPGSVSTASGGV